MSFSTALSAAQVAALSADEVRALDQDTLESTLDTLDWTRQTAQDYTTGHAASYQYERLVSLSSTRLGLDYAY